MSAAIWNGVGIQGVEAAGNIPVVDGIVPECLIVNGKLPLGAEIYISNIGNTLTIICKFTKMIPLCGRSHIFYNFGNFIFWKIIFMTAFGAMGRGEGREGGRFVILSLMGLKRYNRIILIHDIMTEDL